MKFIDCGNNFYFVCTISSKINGIPKGVYLPILKLHSILAVANLLAHNNFAMAKIECSFEMDKQTPLGVPFTLLLMVLLLVIGRVFFK